MNAISETVELAKGFGPTKEDRKKFSATWLGSSLSQMVILVGLVLTYIAVVVALWAFLKEPLNEIRRDDGNIAFFAFLGAPILIILAFNIIPSMLRARRERRLKIATLAGDVSFKPGYFRLHPYGAGDAAAFVRRDGADAALLDWMRQNVDPILYLSGPSGAGKSSLIGAHLVPKLIGEGWTIFNARVFDDPIKQVADALGASNASVESVYQRLEAMASGATAPMLLIIDQFEEFLILNQANQQGPLRNLLNQLTAQPIAKVKVLLSLRSG